MRIARYLLMLGLSALLLSSFCVPSSYAKGPTLNCVPTGGTPPGIDGVYNLGQWPGTPQLVISTPIQTNVYCMFDSTNLYILVDALGDATDDNSVTSCTTLNKYTCDECLLVFGDSNGTTNYVAEVWGKAGTIVGTNPGLPVGTLAQIGFSGHRFYEWSIPLVSINTAPGQTFDFSSPKICKGVGTGDFCYGTEASMPFDGETTNDNEWPEGVSVIDRDTWGQMQLNGTIGVPTLSEWGMIIFMVIAALGSIYFLRKRQKAG